MQSTEQSVSTTNYYKEELFMSKITEEFKEFIMRGNVMDMAVGVIVGGAFSNIINSLGKRCPYACHQHRHRKG